MVSHCSTDWFADHFLGHDGGYSPCLHRHVVLDTTGGRRFSQGEVADDIMIRVLCLDCGEFLSESEVRGTWRGESVEESPKLQLGDDFEDDVIPNREEVKEWQ